MIMIERFDSPMNAREKKAMTASLNEYMVRSPVNGNKEEACEDEQENLLRRKCRIYGTSREYVRGAQ